jgi:hypothetical protein
MIVPSQLTLKTHIHFGCGVSLATLDKLADRLPLPPVSPPIGDTSLTHVMRLAPTAMRQSSIVPLYLYLEMRIFKCNMNEAIVVCYKELKGHEQENSKTKGRLKAS